MKRFLLHIISVLLVHFGTSRESYAQTLPNPAWSLQQITVESIHSYTVRGDQTVSAVSSFVWQVNGGTLYTNAAATTIAGNGTTATVTGQTGNVSTLFVKWDSNVGQGYVSAYEITSYGCQQPVTNQNKYVGVRVNKNAKPEVQFITRTSDYCSDNGAKLIGIELSGLAPYIVRYRESGKALVTVTINQSDLRDLDSDGNSDDYALSLPGWVGINSREERVIVIESISSDGVTGNIGSKSSHTVTIHPLPVISNLQLN